MNTQLYEQEKRAPTSLETPETPGNVPSPVEPIPAGRSYDPNNLLDKVAENLNVADDAELARALELSRPLIGRIRLGKLRVGGTILLRMQELSGIPIQKLRSILGDRRSRFRFGRS